MSLIITPLPLLWSAVLVSGGMDEWLHCIGWSVMEVGYAQRLKDLSIGTALFSMVEDQSRDNFDPNQLSLFVFM